MSFPLLENIRQNILKRFYQEKFNPRKEIDPDLFAHTYDNLSKGLDSVFGEPAWGTPDRDFLEYARKNVAIFSGFKTLEQQKVVQNLLFDKNGNMKSFDQFRRDTLKIMNQYNQNWLRTEYETLVKRARFASDWRKFEANKDLYPNLEWLPSSSIEKRVSHKTFYYRIWSIDDPFWKNTFPGNEWGCKCRVRATDKPVTRINPNGGGKPSPGLEENPGKTGVMFSEEHPYIKNASKSDKRVVDEMMKSKVLKSIGDEKLDERLTAIEDEIRMNKKFETGVVLDKKGEIIIDKRGTEKQVKFYADEYEKMKDCVVTHNHPLGWRYPDNSPKRIGNSFSVEDLILAVYTDAAEVRAVTPNYTFSMKRPKDGWGVDYKTLEEVYKKMDDMMTSELTRRIAKKTLTKQQAFVTQGHLMAQAIAKKYGWIYEKKKTR